MQVELLLAYEDRTWDTEVFDVPVTEQDDGEVVKWWHATMAGNNCYRKVVQVAVYSYTPTEGL